MANPANRKLESRSVNQVLETLAACEAPAIVTIDSTPTPIPIGSADIIAADMLLWLKGQMPEGSTIGELHEVLDAAKWWTITLQAIELADGIPARQHVNVQRVRD